MAEADGDIASALQLKPGSAEALLERGILRQVRGDVAGTRRNQAGAVALAPKTPTADLAERNLVLNEAESQRR